MIQDLPHEGKYTHVSKIKVHCDKRLAKQLNTTHCYCKIEEKGHIDDRQSLCYYCLIAAIGLNKHKRLKKDGIKKTIR